MVGVIHTYRKIVNEMLDEEEDEERTSTSFLISVVTFEDLPKPNCVKNPICMNQLLQELGCTYSNALHYM